MAVSAGIGLAEAGAGAAAAETAFSLAPELVAGIEGGIAEAGLGALGAEAGAAGLGATELGALGAEGLGAAELAAAATPELAAPVAAGAAEAGALAPAAGALAPSVASPAISGLSTVASEAIPGAIAEGAGVTPLTETALDFSLPASTEAGINAGIEEATAQGATQAATQGAEQLGTQAAKQIARDGLSQLAPGAQQVLSDAAPLSSEAGSQLAQAAPEALAPPTAPPVEAPPVAPPTAEAPPAPTSAPPASTAPPAVQPMNPPATTTPPTTPPTFAQPQVQQAVENLARAEAPLAPGTPSPSPLTPDVGSATSYVKSAADAGGEGLLSQAGNYLAKNPMAALSGLGMAYNMMKGQQPPKFSAELQRQAAELNARGAQLQGYLTSGTLPPGIGAALSGAHDSAAAAIRSRYANTGMSGSSAEMQDLNNLAQTTVSQGADIANKLLATGVSQQQFASGLYQNLMATAMQQDTNMSKAISNFTGALARSSVQPRPV